MKENRVIFILIILKPKNTKRSIEFVGGKRQHIFPTTGFWFFFSGFINGRESKLKYWKQGLNFQFFIQNQHVRLEILLKKII